MSDEQEATIQETWFRWPGGRWHLDKRVSLLVQTPTIYLLVSLCGMSKSQSEVEVSEALPSGDRCQRCEVALRKLREKGVKPQ